MIPNASTQCCVIFCKGLEARDGSRSQLEPHECLTDRSEANSIRKELNTPSLAIAVTVYVPEQYARLLATAEDASDLEATWQEWHQVLQDTRQKMARLACI